MAGPKLEVELAAKLDRFQQDMQEAGRIADRQVADIERAFRDANPTISSQTLTAALAGFAGGFGLDKFLDMLVNANRAMAELADNAKKVQLSTDRFQEIRFAANISGIGDKDVATTLDKMAGRLADASRNENDLSKLLDANNVKLKDREGKLISINALLNVSADLIKRGASEQDKIKIAEMLGLTADWVKVLEKGPEEFNRIAKEAQAAGVIIDKETIKKAADFTREWDKAATKWSSGFRASIADLLPLFDKLVAGANFILQAAGQAGSIVAGFGRALTGGFEALNLEDLERMKRDLQAPLGPNFLPESELKKREELLAKIEERIISIRNQNAESADQGKRNDRLRIEVPPGGNTVIPAKPTGTDRDAFDATADRIKRRIAVMEAETSTIGQNSEARERAKVVAELEEAAKRANTAAGEKNIEVTKEQREKINELADAMLKAAERSRQQKQAFEGLNDALRFGGNTLIDVLDRATQKGANFGDIMRDVLRNVTRQLLQAAITGEGAFAKLLGTVGRGGGVGGILGMFTGSGAGAGPINVVGSAGSLAVPTFAEGGVIPAGGLGLVSEHRNPQLIRAGAEPITVTPNSIMPSGGGGGATFAPVYQIDATGADQAAIDRLQRGLIATNAGMEGRFRVFMREEMRRRA